MCNNTSLIQSVQNTPVTLTSNTSALTFNSDDLRTRSANCCGWLQHQEGSPIYKILKGGIYEISFDGNVTSATAGLISLALAEDGVPLPSATIIDEITTANNYIHVSLNKKIKVCCNSDTTISLVSLPFATPLGATAPTATQIISYDDSNFSITKLA